MFHLIACLERFVLSRRQYQSLDQVEADHPDMISWEGPLDEASLRDSIRSRFYPPGTGPFDPELVRWFVESGEIDLVVPWRDV